MLNLLTSALSGDQKGSEGHFANDEEAEVAFLDIQVRCAIDAVQRATVLVDKHNALQEVTRLAASYPADLGYRNDVVFPAVVEMLSHGSDIAMDCIAALFLPKEQQLSPSKAPRGGKSSVARENLRAFAAQGGIQALLGLLHSQHHDQRLPVLQLTLQLFQLDETEVERAILSSPLGMQQLVQLLDDPQDATRNQLLLLLVALTGKSYSTDVQNFLAFEEGFDRLLCILRSEGGGGVALGGSVASLDCLVLLRHVVHGNGVTSKLFLTMADLTVLPALLSIDTDAHLTRDAAKPQVDGLKRGLILHTLQCMATLLNLPTHHHDDDDPDQEPTAHDGQEAGHSSGPEKPATAVGPAAELAASKLSETPGLVEAVAVVALSHAHVGRTGAAGGTQLGIGEQERVLALRVLCRLVARGGPAASALLLRKDEGWLEAVLTHFLSPLVLQEEHEAVEELVLACLGNAAVGARLVHCVVSTGHTVRKRGTFALEQHYLSQGLEEDEALKDVLPGLVSLRATQMPDTSTNAPPPPPPKSAVVGSPARRLSNGRDGASSPTPASPLRGEGGLVHGLLGGLAKALTGEGQGSIPPAIAGMAPGEDALWKLVYRSLHCLVQSPLAWSEEGGRTRAPRLLRATRSARLLRHLLGHGGPPCRLACLEAAVRCAEVAAPLPQLAGLPVAMPIFDGVLQVLVHHAVRSVWSPLSSSSSSNSGVAQAEGNWEEGLLGLTGLQLLCTWVLETPPAVHRLLASPCTWRLLDLLAWLLAQGPTALLPQPHDSLTALLAAHLGANCALLFAVALESLGGEDEGLRAGSPTPMVSNSPCPNRLSLLRAIASRMDVTDFLRAVESARRLWATGGLDLGQALTGQVQQDINTQQNWKELEEQKAFRRLAGLEVTGRLYDAAFVGAAGKVADRARARVARALAYKGKEGETVLDEDVELQGLQEPQCARLIAEQVEEIEALKRRIQELEHMLANKQQGGPIGD